MNQTSNVLKCSKADCDIATTGICSDGHIPLEACPFFGKYLDNKVIEVPKAPLLRPTIINKPVSSDAIKLPTGEALQLDDIDKMLLAHPLKLIAIVGDRDSGKSTLIGTLYDKFSQGNFGDLAFTSSRTLVGFDRLSFYSRVDGGLDTPDTIRTSITEGLKFFHFELAACPDYKNKTHLVISDRAGEVYKEARSNSEEVQKLIELQKCLVLVILLDGERVASLENRANAFAAVRQTLRILADSNILNHSSVVQIVTTKYDLISRCSDEAELMALISQFKTRLTADYKEKIGELTFWNIAARDPSGDMSLGHGLEQLLVDWIRRKKVQVVKPIPIPLVSGSEFDMLINRVRLGE